MNKLFMIIVLGGIFCSCTGKKNPEKFVNQFQDLPKEAKWDTLRVRRSKCTGLWAVLTPVPRGTGIMYLYQTM